MKVKHVQGHCCQHDLLHFCSGHLSLLLCSLCRVETVAPCCRGNAKKVIHLTARAVSARCWEMTSIFTWVICWRGLDGPCILCRLLLGHFPSSLHTCVMCLHTFDSPGTRTDFKKLCHLSVSSQRRAQLWADEDACMLILCCGFS